MEDVRIHWWKNIKINTKKLRVGWFNFGSEQVPAAGCYEYGSYPRDSVQRGECLDCTSLLMFVCSQLLMQSVYISFPLQGRLCGWRNCL